jgi:hypothetical protein
MSAKLPSVGFQEIVLLFCGGGIALLSVIGPGANYLGVLIGLFIVSAVIWNHRRLESWAKREGYEVISMRGISLFSKERRQRLLPDRTPMYRIILRASDGSIRHGVVAFAWHDFGFTKPLLLELDGETFVKNERRSFFTGLLTFGIFNLISIYIIFIGLCSWNEIQTRVLVKAIAMADEFTESHDTALFNRVNYRSTTSYADLSFALPSYFPNKNFLVKAELRIPGRGGSRRLVHKGDIVPLWVDVREPDRSFSIELEENEPEGTIRTSSGKAQVLMGAIGFLITGYALYYYRARRPIQGNGD